jgi:hypothetical protein
MFNVFMMNVNIKPSVLNATIKLFMLNVIMQNVKTKCGVLWGHIST